MSKNTITSKKFAKIIKLTSQIIFFTIVLLTSIVHGLSEIGKTINISLIKNASLHSICPFGGVVSVYKYFTEGSFVQKIHQSSFVLLILALILSLLFGTVFCGFICPFGSIQEWIGKIGKKIFKTKYNRFVPLKFDKYLRYVRYAVLAWVIYITAKTGLLIFVNIDPYHALFTFWTGEVAIQAIIALILTLISSLFVERPFCKYFCPFGAFLGLFNFIRIFKIKRNKSTCISCKACDNKCPMNIKVSEATIVSDPRCITCLECTSEITCPVNNTINLEAIGGKK